MRKCSKQTFPSVGQIEHSSRLRLVDQILRIPHSQTGHSSILPESEQTSPRSLWFAEKINKGKLKWRPNLKLWMWDCDPAEPSSSDPPPDVFSAGQACSESCVLQAALTCKQIKKSKTKISKYLKKKIFLCAFDHLQCSHHEGTVQWIIVRRISGGESLKSKHSF